MKEVARRWRVGVSLLGGFLLWSTVFVMLYGAQATGCRLGWDQLDIAAGLSVQRTLLVALFAVSIVAHLLLLGVVGSRKEDPDSSGEAFADQAGRALALAALGASVFCFSGVIWLTAC